MEDKKRESGEDEPSESRRSNDDRGGKKSTFRERMRGLSIRKKRSSDKKESKNSYSEKEHKNRYSKVSSRGSDHGKIESEAPDSVRDDKREKKHSSKFLFARKQHGKIGSEVSEKESQTDRDEDGMRKEDDHRASSRRNIEREGSRVSKRMSDRESLLLRNRSLQDKTERERESKNVKYSRPILKSRSMYSDNGHGSTSNKTNNPNSSFTRVSQVSESDRPSESDGPGSARHSRASDSEKKKIEMDLKTVDEKEFDEQERGSIERGSRKIESDARKSETTSYSQNSKSKQNKVDDESRNKTKHDKLRSLVDDKSGKRESLLTKAAKR